LNARCLSRFVPRRVLTVAAVLGLSLVLSAVVAVYAGGGLGGGAVGGVRVDLEGVLANIDGRDLDVLVKARREALRQAEGDLAKPTKLRKVSLRRLAEFVRDYNDKRAGAALPDDVKYLAGIQRIQYIFVYPEHKDIVLAGPADGWKINAKGDVVSSTSGMPVMKLDDLLVAFRAADNSRESGISCSIDPTPEGVQRLNAYLKNQKTFQPSVKEGIEKNLGLQKITITGVPATSHFAYVMLAADYRMKRYAMGLEAAPIKGLPSYLEMIQKASARPSADLTPRWWLAADYQPLLTDRAGMAWELRPGVKCLSEDEARAADGSVRGTGRTNALAKRWADSLTAKYNDLCAKDEIFADLRNCIDLAVAAALITKERLAEKAGLDLSIFSDGKQLMADSLPTPKSVRTEVSLAKKQRDWLITASGGVQFSGWQLAAQRENSEKLAPVRDGAASMAPAWWWD
jgi:hypothetical protein